jgi:hypothetical protein
VAISRLTLRDSALPWAACSGFVCGGAQFHHLPPGLVFIFDLLFMYH